MSQDKNGGAMKIDVNLVRELAEMLGDTGLSEIEVEDGERKIRVSRAAPAATQVAYAPAPAITAPNTAPFGASTTPTSGPPISAPKS